MFMRLKVMDCAEVRLNYGQNNSPANKESFFCRGYAGPLISLSMEDGRGMNNGNGNLNWIANFIWGICNEQ